MTDTHLHLGSHSDDLLHYATHSKVSPPSYPQNYYNPCYSETQKQANLATAGGYLIYSILLQNILSTALERVESIC